MPALTFSMENELRKRSKMLAFFFVSGFGLFIAFVVLVLNSYTVPALITGLAGMSLLAVFTIIYIDFTSRMPPRKEGVDRKE